MEDDEKKGKPPSRNEGIWNHFTVAPNFDQTPVTVTALDHYLLDDDVVGLIKTLFENDDGMWSNWGIENEIIAQKFFSEPHSNIAKTQLGYPESFIQRAEDM
jgi:hypothetical protein